MRAAVEAVVPPGADAPTVLRAIYDISVLRELDTGTLTVRSDARWFATYSDDQAGGEPIVELRRWPGDTVVALYAVGPIAEGAPWPPVPGSSFERTASTGDVATLRGTVEASTGERPALWIERPVEGSPTRLAALVLPGDAGLGAAGIAGLEAEAMFLLSRVEVRPAGWQHEAPVPPGVEILLPELGPPPGTRSEETDTWQIVIGRGFTLGLPPGFRSYRLDLDIPVAERIPGALLWIRGRVRDASGDLVAVGDGRRYGYVAQVHPLGAEWIAGAEPPLGAPGASLALARPVAASEMAQGAGAIAATAERWTEPGFAGDWIVFRLRYEEHGVEIGLPVVSGRRSPSLIWIGQGYRPAGWPPAPPPIDAAARFRIVFERLTLAGQKASPWLEGYLRVPGLRADVSRGLVPAATVRSTDGYPVRFQDAVGVEIGTLSRIGARDVAAWIAARPDLVENAKPARWAALRVLSDSAGRDLFIATAGDAFAFDLDPGATEASRAGWRLMMASVRLDRK